MIEMDKIKGVSMHPCVDWLKMSDILLLIIEACALNWPIHSTFSLLLVGFPVLQKFAGIWVDWKYKSVILWYLW